MVLCVYSRRIPFDFGYRVVLGIGSWSSRLLCFAGQIENGDGSGGDGADGDDERLHFYRMSC